VGPEDRARLLAILRGAQALGFLGPVDVETHLDHALVFAEPAVVGRPPERAVDLGSGAGVPGLVLAAVWPSSDWVLLDASLRRTTFVREAVAELGWTDRVEVRRERAESAGRADELRETFDLVVARSFAGPAATAECGAPFLRAGGRLVVSEPPGAAGRWPSEPLDRLGLAIGPTIVRSKVPATMQVLVQARSCPVTYPRRVGVPAKRPLW
jgi:16S rRNA (guanine527-N7)-methyltransferase